MIYKIKIIFHNVSKLSTKRFYLHISKICCNFAPYFEKIAIALWRIGIFLKNESVKLYVTKEICPCYSCISMSRKDIVTELTDFVF